MSGAHTLFMRLAGPMQSWGTSSRFQLRRTDLYPSKSGVFGMLLCAMGVGREDSPMALKSLTTLRMGVRVDRKGTMDWDYHTAGAKIGIRSAEGKIKKTAKTGEYETLLSRRQYIYDASFLVALQGDTNTVNDCAVALQNPTWPLFLGRKCCIPAEPVFAGIGRFDTLADALTYIPWQPRIDAIDRDDKCATRTLDIYVEHPSDSQAPSGARLVYDIPMGFGFYGYASRWVVKDQVTVRVEKVHHQLRVRLYTRHPDHTSSQWKAARASRLELDHHLCVFCKSPAEEAHHVSYQNVGHETDSDLRSLCKICHNACTILEYGQDMKTNRIDPLDPAQRPAILGQINRLLEERRLGSRRELLKTVRTTSQSFYGVAQGALSDKER